MKTPSQLTKVIFIILSPLLLGACSHTPIAALPEVASWNQHVESPKVSKPGKKKSSKGKTSKQKVIISLPERKLYLIKDGRKSSYKIAIPVTAEQWIGWYPVTRKSKKPKWFPTKKMRRNDPNLPIFVQGGHPENPLGSHALYLGRSLYRIHGTNMPWSIGQPASAGCFRMHNKDVAELYQKVKVGTSVRVINKPLS